MKLYYRPGVIFGLAFYALLWVGFIIGLGFGAHWIWTGLSYGWRWGGV